MKKEVSPAIVIAVIAVVAIVAVLFLWKGTAGRKDTMSPLPGRSIGGPKGPPSQPTPNR